MKKLFILIFATCLMIACQNPSEKVTLESPVDSLVSNWANNWNNHDSLAVKNMFESDGILFDDNVVAKNHEDLLIKWIRPSINFVQNMRIEKIQEWATIDRAGFSGLWSIDIVANDSLVAQYEGAFTCNWKKSENGEWKISNAHVHSFKE